MDKEKILDISWQTIFKVFLVAFIFYVFYLSRDIVFWFFFALIISVLLEPAINFFRWIRVPKILSISLVYLFIFGFLGVLIYVTAPIFVYELSQFSQNIPEYFMRISPFLEQVGIDVSHDFDSLTEILVKGLQQGSRSVVAAAASVFGGVVTAFFILVFAFFLSVEERGVEKFLVFMAPQKYEEHIKFLFERVQKKVSGWFGARLLSCLFVGAASFIIFYIFGIRYAFLLALISGVMNFIPYIGPWVTAIILVVFVAVSTNSWIMALYVLIAIAIVQAVENNILTPVLMKRMIGLPPILVLLALLIGAQIFGLLGAVFSVPVFGIIYEFTKEFLEKKRTVSVTQLDENQD